jgi:DNA-binding transcriptional LysR family regulator
LTVGYIALVLASLLTPALRTFGQKNPEVEVVLREMSPGEQVKALREGKIDLALPVARSRSSSSGILVVPSS